MGQILLQDNIPKLVKATSTTCTLAATNLGQSTRITLGGKQYRPTSSLTLNTATTGLGGLDTGSVDNNNSLYYVYFAANSSGTYGLIASLNSPSVGPTGYTTRYKLVGAFYSMDSGNQIGSTVTIEGKASSEWQQYTSTYGSAPFGNAGAKTFTYNGRWRRDGDILHFVMHVDGDAVAAGNDTSHNPVVYHPSPFLIDTSKLPGSLGGENAKSGTWSSIGLYSTGGTTNDGVMIALDTTRHIFYKGWNGTAFDAIVMRTSDLNVARTVSFMFTGSVPVQGWTKTLLG